MIRPPNRDWILKEAKKHRTKLAVNAYCQMKIKGESINWKTVGEIYRPGQERPDLTVKRLFRQQEIKAMIEQKLNELLELKGITQEYVIDNLKDAHEIAKDKKDALTMLKINDNFQDLLGMKPHKIKQTQQLLIDDPELDKLNGAIQKAKLERQEVYNELPEH